MENKTIKKCSLNEIFKYSRKMIARAAIPSNEEDFLNSIIDLYEKRVQRKAETDKNRNEYEFQLDLKYGYFLRREKSDVFKEKYKSLLKINEHILSNNLLVQEKRESLLKQNEEYYELIKE